MISGSIPMLRKPFLLVLLILGLLLQTTPAPLHTWALISDELAPASFPAGAVPVNAPTAGDFDNDGILETLSLADGRLSILSAGRSVWQSPQAWTVLQVDITDLNRDGQPEATLLLWRPFQPWPVDLLLPHGGRIASFHDGEGNSCHIILIGWTHFGYGELWAGSAMADPVTAFAAADLNADGGQELVTLEGRYTGSGSTPARTLKVWTWNGFGFTVVSSVDGSFSDMTLVRAEDSRILILVP